MKRHDFIAIAILVLLVSLTFVSCTSWSPLKSHRHLDTSSGMEREQITILGVVVHDSHKETWISETLYPIASERRTPSWGRMKLAPSPGRSEWHHRYSSSAYHRDFQLLYDAGAVNDPELLRRAFEAQMELLQDNTWSGPAISHEFMSTWDQKSSKRPLNSQEVDTAIGRAQSESWPDLNQP